MYLGWQSFHVAVLVRCCVSQFQNYFNDFLGFFVWSAVPDAPPSPGSDDAANNFSVSPLPARAPQATWPQSVPFSPVDVEPQRLRTQGSFGSMSSLTNVHLMRTPSLTDRIAASVPVKAASPASGGAHGLLPSLKSPSILSPQASIDDFDSEGFVGAGRSKLVSKAPIPALKDPKARLPHKSTSDEPLVWRPGGKSPLRKQGGVPFHTGDIRELYKLAPAK